MYVYDLDLLKMQLNANKAVTDSEVISEIIQSDLISASKKNMEDGENYYCSNNSAIYERVFEYYSQGRNVKDEFRANNKLPHGFLKTLIDQKVNYSLSKPITLNNADNIKQVLDINEFIRDVGKQACKKAFGWLHIFINENNELETKVIDSEEIIPIFDTRYQDELIQIIRYYTFTVINDKGTKINRYKVEQWTAKEVTFYEQDLEGNFVLDSMVEINPAPHWMINNYSLGELTYKEDHSWGKVPFIPLFNNDEKLTDLVPIKAFIDCYDKNISDFSNNIEDLQEAIIKLINYGGMTDRLEEFLVYVKKYKVLPLDDEGNAEYMKNEIPFEARLKLKESLRESIFEFGQGVDSNKVGDGNITNIVITNRYTQLDLKANDFELNVTKFLKKVFWFANEFLKFRNMQQDDIKLIEIIYNRSLVINNLEIVDMCQKSAGIISNKTIISNHPWVSDVEDELTQMETEKEAEREIYFNTQQENMTMQESKNVENVDNSVDNSDNEMSDSVE
jgi:SPP1 family phage portal protein